MLSFATAILSSLCYCTSTTSITIDNNGFEADGPLPENTYKYGRSIISNWEKYDPKGLMDGSVGIQNPTNGTHFNDSIFGDSSPEGSLCAFLEQSHKKERGNGEIGIFQKLTAFVTANTTYTLNVYVGNGASACWSESSTDGAKCLTDTRFAGYRVQLLGDAQLLAEDDNTRVPSIGQWVESEVTVTVLPGNSNIGKQLKIMLINKNVDGNEVAFDDVRLDAFPITQSPTSLPTQSPTSLPTQSPTPFITPSPTSLPTQSPTPLPTRSPSEQPTVYPSVPPTDIQSEITTSDVIGGSTTMQHTEVTNRSHQTEVVTFAVTSESEQSSTDLHIQLDDNDRQSDISIMALPLGLVSGCILCVLCVCATKRRKRRASTRNVVMVTQNDATEEQEVVMVDMNQNQNEDNLRSPTPRSPGTPVTAQHPIHNIRIHPEMVLRGSAMMTQGDKAKHSYDSTHRTQHVMPQKVMMNTQYNDAVQERPLLSGLSARPLDMHDTITLGLLRPSEIVAILCDAYDQNGSQPVQGNGGYAENYDHLVMEEGVRHCDEDVNEEEEEHKTKGK
eukprot:1166401_1